MARTSVIKCDMCDRVRPENARDGWTTSSVTMWDKEDKPTSWEQDLCPDHSPKIPGEFMKKKAGPITAV